MDHIIRNGDTDEFYVNNTHQAAYGMDIDQALKVASYILSEVYQIPTSYKLSLDLSTPHVKW